VNSIFIDPETNRLRSGWRALLYLILSPFVFILLGPLLARSGAEAAGIGLSLPTIITYAVQVVWLLLAAWLCLKYLEKMRLASLGFGFLRGWWRETWLGLAIAALMMSAVVALQFIGGGTRMMLNPLFWKTVDGARSLDFIGGRMIARDFVLAFVLFALAAAFEELLFRGFPFQTLLRGGVPAAVPIVLLSVFFGLVHVGNPSSTMFSTVNTILAGIWLAVAYLKTRRLWFPTALHLGWNWMMGAVFGLPVSGLKFVPHPVLLSTSQAPLWLTGGDYGCEGGVAATLVLVVATVVIWQAKWLQVAPGMQAALQPSETETPATIKLGLRLVAPRRFKSTTRPLRFSIWMEIITPLMMPVRIVAHRWPKALPRTAKSFAVGISSTSI
jgi:membrane protease YdiL (CAAX protease family)